MTDLAGAPWRLRELGRAPELVAWLERQGYDAEVVCFAALCAARDALSSQAGERGATGRAAAFAFLTGFFLGVCCSEQVAPQPVDTAAAFARAAAAIAARGRHAVIADRCDLATVAAFECEVADALAGVTDGEHRRTVLRLFECGLATALAVAA